jgi:hypothetical protein
MSTIRLTAAQALVRFLAAPRTAIDGVLCPLFVRRMGDFPSRQRRGHLNPSMPSEFGGRIKIGF